MTAPARTRPFELPDAETLARAVHTLAVGMAAKRGCTVQHAANLVVIAIDLHHPSRLQES